MSFAAILAKHASASRNLIRDIEKTSRKITNAEAAILFNNQCIGNNLLPKYIYIYMYIIPIIQATEVIKGQGLYSWFGDFH